MVIEERSPSAGELRSLAQSVGWEAHFDWDTMQDSLDGSLYGVVALDDGVVVASGRIVGDGVRYFYMQDVIVRPDAADDGVATEIVQRLLAWIRSHAAPQATLSLFASPNAVGVYAAQGFTPATGDPQGMTLELDAADAPRSSVNFRHPSLHTGRH